MVFHFQGDRGPETKTWVRVGVCFPQNYYKNAKATISRCISYKYYYQVCFQSPAMLVYWRVLGCPRKLVTIVRQLIYKLFPGRIQPTYIVVIIHLLSTMDISPKHHCFSGEKIRSQCRKRRGDGGESRLCWARRARGDRGRGKQNIVGGCLFFSRWRRFLLLFFANFGLLKKSWWEDFMFHLTIYAYIFFNMGGKKDAIHSGIRWPRFFMMLEGISQKNIHFSFPFSPAVQKRSAKNWLDYKQKGAKKRRGGLQALLLLFLLVSVRALFLSALQPRRQKMTAPGWTR